MSAPVKANVDPNLAQHPKFFASKVEPGMKLPGDTRLFRNIKLYEIPQWFMKRDFSPLGLYFSLKRFRHQWYTKYYYVRNMKGVPLAQLGALLSLGGYISQYEYIQRTQLKRKYH